MAKKKKSKREKIGAYSKKFDAKQAADQRKESRQFKAGLVSSSTEIAGLKKKHTDYPKQQYSPAEVDWIEDRIETYVIKKAAKENVQRSLNRYDTVKSENAMKNSGLRLAKQAEARAHASYKKQQKRNN